MACRSAHGCAYGESACAWTCSHLPTVQVALILVPEWAVLRAASTAQPATIAFGVTTRGVLVLPAAMARSKGYPTNHAVASATRGIFALQDLRAAAPRNVHLVHIAWKLGVGINRTARRASRAFRALLAPQCQLRVARERILRTLARLHVRSALLDPLQAFMGGVLLHPQTPLQ